MFLKVNKHKHSAKGSVYIAEIKGKGLLIGCVRGKYKIADILLSIPAKVITGRSIPKITLKWHKKVTDCVAAEANLNSCLFEHYDEDIAYLTSDFEDIQEDLECFLG